MKADQITDESIRKLVDNFYLKIRAHEALGPVFENMIGHTDSEWRPHLERMYDFWSSVMTTSGRYHGNPMQKHKDIPYFAPELFDTWLEIFAQTAHEVHSKSIAELYIERSKRIAESLKAGLYFKPKAP